MSTFSPNLQFEEVARGGDVGTWDTPTNSNWSISDLALGGTATIPLGNANVILSAAQFQCKTLVFNSTLTGNVTITFPTTYTKSYEIFNQCTGIANVITLQTTVASASVVCAPPGIICEIANVGGNMFYKNLGGPIGTYADFAMSSTPNWNDFCTTPPYLNCAGGGFSSANYPVLAALLGATTLPDTRSATRYTLAQGAARLSQFTQNTLLSLVGSQQFTLISANLPPYTPSGSVATNVTSPSGNNPLGLLTNTGGPVNTGGSGSGGTNVNLTAASVFTGSAQGGVSQAVTTASPGIMAGITMIRAA